jgi:restriction system protein
VGGRRKDDGLLDSLFEIARLLPWWLDLVIAAAAGIGLHHVERTTQPALATAPSEAGNQLTVTLVHALATVGQFVVPLVFVVGAVASVVARRHRAGLLRRAGDHNAETAISEMSWQNFEQLVHEVFHQRGYSVEPLGGSRPDGGVDLIARRQGEVNLIQCKHWRTKQVGVKVARELLGVVTAKGATSGTVVTSGTYTTEAIRFAQAQRIELIDGAALRSAAHRCRPTPSNQSPCRLQRHRPHQLRLRVRIAVVPWSSGFRDGALQEAHSSGVAPGIHRVTAHETSARDGLSHSCEAQLCRWQRQYSGFAARPRGSPRNSRSSAGCIPTIARLQAAILAASSSTAAGSPLGPS